MGIVNVGKLVLTSNSLVLKTVDIAGRDALTGMRQGSLIFNTEEEVLEFYDGIGWTQAYKPKGNLVYEFSNYTFVSGMPRGQAVASTQNFSNLYAGQAFANGYFSYNQSTGIQSWQVPATGTYRIEVGGARGGRDNNYGIADVWGAKMRGEFDLDEGTVLGFRIGSGGNQYTSPHGNECGGGGGTYVTNSTNGTTLIVAGGGGGSAGNVYGNSCTRNLQTAYGQTSQQSVGTTCQGSYTASTPTTQQGGGGGGGSYWGGGGGGFLGNGTNGYNHCGTPTGGKSYTNGSVGGVGDGCYTSGGQGNRGGYGGGGGGNLSGPGGGGGYTGGTSSGSWSSYSQHGGGGGSFNGGSNQVNSKGGNSGNQGGYAGAGYVKVTIML